MNIYIDFDDCLCETARNFTTIVKNLFDMDFPYEDIKFFDLKRTFSLDDAQYQEMMRQAHRPEVLLSYKETLGASKTVNEWIDQGHNVSIITGRPSASYEPSRMWLDQHGLDRAKLYCLNKYSRDSFYNKGEFTLELEDYYRMHFDYAVEDSPAAFKYFDHLPDLKVMVFDRPWNQDVIFPGDNFRRCTSWDMIKDLVV